MDEKTKAYVITELALLNEDPDIIRGWVSMFGLLSFLEENADTPTNKSLYILDRLTRREHLTPITDDPKHWEEVRPGVWQSTRNPDIFSEDHGYIIIVCQISNTSISLRRLILMEMNEFIRKPFAVQAIQITEENIAEVADFVEGLCLRSMTDLRIFWSTDVGPSRLPGLSWSLDDSAWNEYPLLLGRSSRTSSFRTMTLFRGLSGRFQDVTAVP